MNDEGTFPREGFQQSDRGSKPCPHCPECGSSDIATGLEFGLNAEVGPFGLIYKAVAFLKGTEKLHADLCRSCGTVLRLFVNNTQRNWIQREDKKKNL
jgi:hypothetical protein